ncbi:DUF2691 family protein [Bacillus suaedae]|uniref:DUF2691 family protein n=1 Tax=Halalkalibacter suaedae TaxID=2822140 RepID=A0A940WT71_9BACI|nr:DUF2691 family protein [Bacillus suaedae]
MLRGVSFEIPNKYGTFLADILKPIELSTYNWLNQNEEAYIIKDGHLDEELFPGIEEVIDGSLLENRIKNNQYYVIFADLKAFPKGEKVHNIKTYEEFSNSRCELVLLVVDSGYITIYCKDKEKLNFLHRNAIECSFENVEYITDENDGRTGLSVW